MVGSPKFHTVQVNKTSDKNRITVHFQLFNEMILLIYVMAIGFNYII